MGLQARGLTCSLEQVVKQPMGGVASETGSGVSESRTSRTDVSRKQAKHWRYQAAAAPATTETSSQGRGERELGSCSVSPSSERLCLLECDQNMKSLLYLHRVVLTFPPSVPPLPPLSLRLVQSNPTPLSRSRLLSVSYDEWDYGLEARVRDGVAIITMATSTMMMDRGPHTLLKSECHGTPEKKNPGNPNEVLSREVDEVVEVVDDEEKDSEDL
ncbi:unnamed protein product [Pleuronectes platessa]|uniref:Uncharacterized protein n=1 Tax=Pleuronectes platessa TaxID=8262 RepID=A0A9N7UR88_PLEPL|nr:unnamed protein product [Pleuronectes platessa]